MKLFEIFGEVALKGQEAVIQGLSGLDEKAASTSDRMTAMGESMERNGATMTKWVTGPILAAGAGLLALGTKLGNTADRILDLAEITGMSTGAIQQWQHVAKMAGTDAEALTRASQRLNREMTAVMEGTGKTAEALGELGISAQAFAAQSPDERVNMLVGALQGVEDPAERARLGSELFSREWEKIAPIVGLGADELARLREEGDKFAMDDKALQRANEFRMSMERLKAEFGLVVQELSLALMPIMEALVAFIQNAVLPVLRILGGAIGLIGDAFGILPGPIQGLVMGLIGLVAAIGPVMVIGGKLLKLFAGFPAAVMAITAAKTGLAASMLGVSTAAAPMLAALLPFAPMILAGVAAVTAIIAIFKNWDRVVEFTSGVIDAFSTVIGAVWPAMVVGWNRVRDAFSDVWNFASDMLADLGPAIQGWASSVVSWIGDMASGVISTITGMVKRVTDAVSGMVSGTIDRLKGLYQRVVGNSIIPDMVREVGDEMQHMAKDGQQQAGRFANNVTGQLERVTAPSMRGQVAAQGAGGGATVVDMRWATIRDDRDMLERMMRSGAGVSGFA